MLLPASGDPGLKAENLSAEMRLWHTRLWAAIRHPKYRGDTLAAANDTYTLGRKLNDHVTALIAAFRATGDFALLDECDRLMEIARANLKDADGDGYLNWVWKADPKSKDHYNKDIHPMDEAMTHSLVAMIAYVLKVNGQHRKAYADHAAFWIDYMENHFLAKWKKRGGIDRHLFHPYTALMRMHYYLYRVTGKKDYRDEASRRHGVFRNHMKVSPAVPTAFIWQHSVKTEEHGWQPINYAHYVITYIQDLALDGFGSFSSPDYMAHFASTYRDIVYNDGTRSMAERVDGSGKAGFEMYTMGGLGRWDSTGKLRALTEEAFQKDTRVIYPPAYMLMVLSSRSPGP
jgi:hypothetical protein